nr:hypothetical protein [uncultured Campylobacter sp.]
MQSLDSFYGAVPAIRSHIRAYKFNQVYAWTARFDEYGKTAVLIATARRKFELVLYCDGNDKHNVSFRKIKPVSRQNPKPLKFKCRHKMAEFNAREQI